MRKRLRDGVHVAHNYGGVFKRIGNHVGTNRSEWTIGGTFTSLIVTLLG